MSIDGFCGKLWNIMEHRMNFTSVHSIPPEGGNRWEEMMYACVRGEADVTSTYITHTSDRDVLVDFSFPMATIPMRIFITLSGGRDVTWKDILTPFSHHLWLALSGTTLAAAALLACLYSVGRRLNGESDVYPLTDAVFLVFGAIFCQQGHARSPRSSPCRIVHMFMYLLGMIAISSYSGVLISNLTVYIQSLPFSNMEGLYKDGRYQFGMINKSLSHILLKNAKSGVLKNLYGRDVENNPANTPITYLEGFQRVCAMRFAFVALSEALTLFRDELNCTAIYLPQQYLKFSASYAFPKHSPYRGLFNHNLFKLMHGGVLKDLHRASLAIRPTSPSDETSPINMEAATPILSIVVGGFFMSLLCACSERLLVFCSRRLLSCARNETPERRRHDLRKPDTRRRAWRTDAAILF